MTAANPPLLAAGTPAPTATERIGPRHRRRLRFPRPPRLPRPPCFPRPLRRLTGVLAVLAIWQLPSSTGRLPQTIVGSPSPGGTRA